jgi:inosine/xanthosine triphosphate pyrophosphatase family protein
MKKFVLLTLLLCTPCFAEQVEGTKKPLHINTSNPGKFEEFKRLFAKYGIPLTATHEDLAEIDADPVAVVAHKATSVPENVIVEDIHD